MMSPTVFRDGPHRFFFFSREEDRMHVHVMGPTGEAKFWIEPKIEFAASTGLSGHQIRKLQKLVEEHENEIRQAWDTHFRRRSH